MSRAIVTVGVSRTRHFKPYLDRFRATFAELGRADEIIVWDQDWPPGSLSHQECQYAFKVHAVQEARRRGHETVLWLDSSAHAFRSLDPLWERLERVGYYLVADRPNPLGWWSSDHSLQTCGVTRDQAMDYPLMCGTCWGVDMRHLIGSVFLSKLHGYATPEHFNGTHVSRLRGLPRHQLPSEQGKRMSDDPRCKGHRSDEVYMSLIARELEMDLDDCTEFIGGNPDKGPPRSCVKSGYDLPDGLP